MAATAVTYERGSKQFQGAFSELWQVKATVDAASLIDAAGETHTVAVPGVALGDMVIAVSLGVDIAGLIVTGYVSAASVVTIQIQNESAGTVDLASTALKILVGRPAW